MAMLRRQSFTEDAYVYRNADGLRLGRQTGVYRDIPIAVDYPEIPIDLGVL